MGGVFKSTFDLSEILAITSDLQSADENTSRPLDTTIVFKDFLENFKDSISGLPMERQKQLYKMQDVIVDLQRDENKDIFNFTIHKPFTNFEELKQINEQMDEALSLVQNLNAEGSEVPADKQMEGLKKSDPVIYSFSNNTFSRFQQEKVSDTEADPEESGEGEDMSDFYKSQFDDIFKTTFYTMTYTFPKPIKSISNKDAVISDDRKTMTFKTDLKAVNNDPDLMNLEVILQD